MVVVALVVVVVASLVGKLPFLLPIRNSQRNGHTMLAT
jgi:hypothetical protein